MGCFPLIYYFHFWSLILSQIPIKNQSSLVKLYCEDNYVDRWWFRVKCDYLFIFSSLLHIIRIGKQQLTFWQPGTFSALGDAILFGPVLGAPRLWIRSSLLPQPVTLTWLFFFFCRFVFSDIHGITFLILGFPVDKCFEKNHMFNFLNRNVILNSFIKPDI